MLKQRYKHQLTDYASQVLPVLFSWSKELRLSMKLSQTAVQDKLGLSTGYISKLENRKFKNPSLETMVKLFELYREDLFDVMDSIEDEICDCCNYHPEFGACMYCKMD